MKDSLNFLPQKSEKKTDPQRMRIIRWGSFTLLSVFLIFNLILFGLYFFLGKNTGDTLIAISRQEAIIADLSETETAYRQLKQKLSFLTAIWREPQRVNAGLIFVNAFMGPEASLEKMNFNQDGLIVLNLFSLDSLGIESFLNKSQQAQQDGKMMELKMNSVNRDSGDKKLGYKFILNFKLGEK